MARYAPDHKAKTRAHLVETARAEFRERGFDAASIETLMRAAGLTRGGFYAHFESKEALVREVLEIESGLTHRLHEAAQSGEAVSEATRAFEDYLDPAQRAGLVQCPLVAHPMDARRGGSDRAAIYTDQIRSLINALEQVTDGNENEAPLLAAMAVGAAILGAVVTDNTLAAQLEQAVSQELRRRLETGDDA